MLKKRGGLIFGALFLFALSLAFVSAAPSVCPAQSSYNFDGYSCDGDCCYIMNLGQPYCYVQPAELCGTTCANNCGSCLTDSECSASAAGCTWDDYPLLNGGRCEEDPFSRLTCYLDKDSDGYVSSGGESFSGINGDCSGVVNCDATYSSSASNPGPQNVGLCALDDRCQTTTGTSTRCINTLPPYEYYYQCSSLTQTQCGIADDCSWADGACGPESSPPIYFGYDCSDEWNSQSNCNALPNCMFVDETDCLDSSLEGENFIPVGYSGVDCNDDNSLINPGVTESTLAQCSDSVDNDCDSLIDCNDPNCDTYCASNTSNAPTLINPGVQNILLNSAELITSTDIYAECRYHDTSTTFASMTQFSTTFSTSHSSVVSGLTSNTNYSYYLKCMNDTESLVSEVTFTTLEAGVPICGDGNVNQDREECDGNDLNGATCQTLGWTNGTLSCYVPGHASECTYDTSSCTNDSGGVGIGYNATGPVNVRWVDTSFSRDPYASITVDYNATTYVIMGIGNSSMTQGEGTFEVWEDDGLLPSSLMNTAGHIYNPTTIVGYTIPEGNIGAVLTLNSTLFDQENEPSGIYEFYFVVDDNNSMTSEILEVTVRDDGVGGEPTGVEGYWTNPVGSVITTWTYSISSNQVALVIDNSGLPEGPVTFTIEEEDALGDDMITTVIGNVDSSGKALGLWTMIDLNFEDADPENDGIYEFKFSAEGIGSSILEVEYGQEIIDCVGISYCSNYVAEDVCIVDACLVANATGSAQGIDCTEEGVNCECVWNTTTDTCGLGSSYVDPVSGNAIGSCEYAEDLSTDDCEDGFLSYSWTANFVWDPSNNATSSQGEGWVEDEYGFWHYDPLQVSLECISGSNTVPCPAQIQLNFFTAVNILGALIIIFVIYYLLRAHKRRELEKKAKKKVSRKKIKRKKK